MQDKEIIKALGNKKYGGHSCVNCKFGITKGEDRCGLKGCNIARNALDLINRQQAEIERFKKIETTVNGFWSEIQKLAMFKDKETPTLEELLEYMDNLKAEAINECLEKLKDYEPLLGLPWDICKTFADAIDSFRKEMVGDSQ